MTSKDVTIESTKVLMKGDNDGRAWTMRKVFFAEQKDFDVVTFDDRVPDQGEVRVLVEEQPPYGGRRQFRIRSAS